MSGSHVRQIFGRMPLSGYIGSGIPLRAGDVDAERAEIAGVQHVGRVDLLEVVGELRAVGIRDRVDDDVHLVELLAIAGSVSSSSAILSTWLVDDTSFACCRAE